MEKSIQQVIAESPYMQPMTTREVLETYADIQLTEEETDQAILQAKVKKKEILKERARAEREAETRRRLMAPVWPWEQTKGFMLMRKEKIFDKKFDLDRYNSALFDALCKYFSSDPKFNIDAMLLGVDNPSLDKGILIAGSYGVGKTWMMELFEKNHRQVFQTCNAKMIADSFEADGQQLAERFYKNKKLPVNDAASFYHKTAGLCIDDMGTEEIKNHFGNKKNVIGDLLEVRYANNNYGPFLHGTTNMDAEGLYNFYGGRISSRLKQMFNIFFMTGVDRRR